MVSIIQTVARRSKSLDNPVARSPTPLSFFTAIGEPHLT
jgi:hypothetical protein